MRPLSRSLFLLGLLSSAAWSAPLRLAVLSPDDPDLGALLTMELGKQSGVQVVERAEMDRLVAERSWTEAIAAGAWPKLGELLHADALAIVSHSQAGEAPLEAVRLVAVQPGVVVDSAIVSPDRAALPTEASRLATQFAPLLAKIGFLDPASVVKLSLLGLRFTADSPLATASEHALNSLLADRLTHRSRILVLERWNLAAAAWEKDLAAGEPSPFWTGSALVDGRIAEQNGTLTVDVRLRKPGEAPATFSITRPADHLADFAEALAGRIAQAVAVNGAAPAWDRAGEAANEILLARWALGNRLYRDAEEAASTADALQPSVPEIDLLRLQAETQMALRQPPIIDNWMWRPYDVRRDGVPDVPPQIAWARIALDHLRVLWSRSQDAPSDPAYAKAAGDIRKQAVYTVQQASRLLAAAHAQRKAWPDQADALRDLRQDVRDTVDLLFRQKTSYQSWVCSFLFPFVPYWFDTPADALAFYRRLAQLPDNAVFPELPTDVRPWFSGTRPWLVSWQDDSPASLDAAWDGFLNTLLHSPSLQDQATGWVWRIQSTPEIDRPDLLRQTAGFVWTNREAAVRTDHPVDFSAVGELLVYQGWRLNAFRTDPAVASLASDFVPFLLKSGVWISPRTLHAFGMVGVSLAPESVAAWAPAFHDYRSRTTAFPEATEWAKRALDGVERDLFGSPSSAAGPVYAPHIVKLDGVVPGGLAWAESRVWLADFNRREIVSWNPANEARDAIPYGGTLPGTPSFLAVGDRAVWARVDDQLWEYDRSTRAWIRLPLPSFTYEPAAAGAYAAAIYWPHTGEGEGGGLLRIDPATQAVSNVLSSRSAPPRNDLDGRADSRNENVFVTPDGQLDYVVKLSNANKSTGFRLWQDCHDDLYTQKRPDAPWEKVLSVTSTFVRRLHLLYHPAPDGALIVTKCRIGKTRLSSFSQLIAWSRSSGTRALLLSNPAAEAPPLPGPARWEMPADLASTETTAPTEVFPLWHGDTLWVVRWEEPEDQGIRNVALYRFRPGSTKGERVALNLDATAASPPPSHRYWGDASILGTPDGIVLHRLPESGLWYLPFSELDSRLDSAR